MISCVIAGSVKVIAQDGSVYAQDDDVIVEETTLAFPSLPAGPAGPSFLQLEKIVIVTKSTSEVIDLIEFILKNLSFLFLLVWLFGIAPFFKVVAGLHFFIITSFLSVIKNCQDESKVGGSLVCIIPLCRFFNLPITYLLEWFL